MRSGFACSARGLLGTPQTPEEDRCASLFTPGSIQAPYPAELAERLIRMFSFAGDTILDPFLGTGSTTVAAIRSGRNSIGLEIEDIYLKLARVRIESEIKIVRHSGATTAKIIE